MVRVILADDESLVRAGVRSILVSDPQIEIVGEAEDGVRALELIREHRPDVVLLDVRMPRLDGLSAMSRIHDLAPGTAVIILTTFLEDEYISAALSGGALGFMLKTTGPRELIAGVHAVAAGAAYLSPRVARRVAAAFGTGPVSRRSSAIETVAVLSDREREVLSLIAAGLSNAEIGERIHVVEGTVKNHVRAILQRLGVRNRVQAAILGHEAGLMPEDR